MWLCHRGDLPVEEFQTSSEEILFQNNTFDPYTCFIAGAFLRVGFLFCGTTNCLIINILFSNDAPQCLLVASLADAVSVPATMPLALHQKTSCLGLGEEHACYIN